MDIVRERYEIAIERIKEISTENISNEKYQEYFSKVAKFILKLNSVKDEIESGRLKEYTTEQLEQFKELEPYRYAYGLDIFDFLYVRVMGKLHKIDDKVQDAVLNVLGIDTEVVPKLRNKKQLKGVLKLLSTLGEKEFILCISPYVYSRDTILKGFGLKEREKTE